MTIIEIYFPDPLFDALALVADSFKIDLKQLVVDLVRQDIESMANNKFTDIADTLVKKVTEHLETYDNMPE